MTDLYKESRLMIDKQLLEVVAEDPSKALRLLNQLQEEGFDFPIEPSELSIAAREHLVREIFGHLKRLQSLH